MRYLLILTFLVAACGTHHTGSTQSADSAPITLAVTGTADLPACNSDNRNQLVYVRDPGQFQECDGGSWSVIDIKGPAGDAGPKGDKGDAGPAGPGATVLPTNVVQDSVTKRYWFFASQQAWSATMCPTGWAAPSPDDLISAVGDGIFGSFLAKGIMQAAWTPVWTSGTAPAIPNSHLALAVDHVDYTGNHDADTTLHYVLCWADQLPQ